MSDGDVKGWGAIGVAAYLGIGAFAVIAVFAPIILAHPVVTGTLITAAYRLFKQGKSVKDVATELGLENSVGILEAIKKALEGLGVL